MHSSIENALNLKLSYANFSILHGVVPPV